MTHLTPDPYTVIQNRIQNHLHAAYDEILLTLGPGVNLDHVDELVWDLWGSAVGLEWAQYTREKGDA